MLLSDLWSIYALLSRKRKQNDAIGRSQNVGQLQSDAMSEWNWCQILYKWISHNSHGIKSMLLILFL